MYPNIVAMLGLIMPEPFATPVTVMASPSMVTCLLTAFATVSVVMIADANSSQLSGSREFASLGIAARSLSMGNRSPITPVEKGWSELDSSSSTAAARWHRSMASLRPGSPVAALALPLLANQPRAICSLSFATQTGGAAKADWVYTPATTAEGSNTTSARSSRSPLIPELAAARRTPGTGSRFFGVERFTAISQQISADIKAARDIACTFYPNRRGMAHCDQPYAPHG